MPLDGIIVKANNDSRKWKFVPVETMVLRIWVAGLALLVVVCSTLFMIGYDIVAHKFMDDLHTWAIIALVWVVTVPNIGRLRKMVADQSNGLK